MGKAVSAALFLDVVPFPGALLWDFACRLVFFVKIENGVSSLTDSKEK
jgi:hypothetical protein